jgi:ribosome maturation factor RimP
MGPTREHLIEVVEPAVNAAGYDLVDLEFRREPHAFVLRIFVDLLEAEAEVAVAGGVTVADCERASRTVSAALDVADPIPVKYALEVSSPGLDRPLRRQSDYKKFAGRRARIKLHDPIEGRRNFTGVLREAADGIVHIEADGREFALPLALIVKAHLEYDL